VPSRIRSVANAAEPSKMLVAPGTTVGVFMIQVLSLLSAAMFILGVVLMLIGGWKVGKAFAAWWDERHAGR
jgi:hypothetical protein